MSNSPVKTMKNKALLLASVMAASVIASGSVFACSFAQWSSTSGGVVANQPNGLAGDPGGNTDNIARYEGFCAMRVTNSGFAEDNRPNGINRIITRFYVLTGQGTGTTTLYEGYSDTGGASPVFRIDYNGTNFTLTDTATGANVSTAGAAGWNSVEIDWISGAGTGSLSLIVNGGAAQTTGSLNNDASSVSIVRLGMVSGGSGNYNFDGYVSQRSTPVGRLCEGEVDGDDNRTINDMLAIFTEIQTAGGTLATGQPDFDADGAVTINDLVGIFQLIQTAQGACS